MRWFLLLILSVSAVWAQPLVNIETVTVGDPGNEPDPTVMFDGTAYYGSVPYEYRIGKHEITIEQYARFLNAVARTNTSQHILDLWSPYMQSDLRTAGISRNGNGTPANPFEYAVVGPSGAKPSGASSPGNRPIAFVSWFDAARFANWVHNGATNGADTENGAYALNGATSGVILKSAGAKWWIPSEDEWYKAAYYKGGGTNVGYWKVPTQSDSTPQNIIGGGTNQANFYFWNGSIGVYAITQSRNIDYNQNYLTDVGAFASSPGPYGTFDQAGNVSEWNDAVVNQVARGNRGGTWYGSNSDMKSNNRGGDWPEREFDGTGFRLATAELGGPKLIVEFPEGIALTNNAPSDAFLSALLGNSSVLRTYTMSNSGGAEVRNIAVVQADEPGSGSHDSRFLLTPPATNSLSPGESTTFSVAFEPTLAGPRATQISITSNDTNNSPFIINLSGFGLGEDLDTDGDGLNDAAEFTMSALGFDWQSNQPTLVAALYSNANRAQLFTQLQYDLNRTNGQIDVTTNPAAFNLFTESQYNANYSSGVTAGISTVLSNPASYNLYDSNSIMDLRMGGLMIQKQNNQAIVVFRIQTTTNLATQPFTNYGTPLTNLIVMPEKYGFCRIEASAGAVYVGDPNQAPPTIEPETTPTPTPSAP